MERRQRQDLQFEERENKLQLQELNYGYGGGVELSDDERHYLLPHFLMLIIGKPGSGKTVLMRQMLMNRQMYKGKFDEVIIVSPSYAKMDIDIDPKYASPVFSLDWIFDHIREFSERQEEQVYGHPYGGVRKAENKLDPKTGKPEMNTALMGDERSRFMMLPMLKALGQTGNYNKASKPTLLGHEISTGIAPASESKGQSELELYRQEMLQLQDMYKEIEKMDPDQRKKSHLNVLIVLDDVAGQIKKAEFDPRLSQLVMNRRHLIPNGTISIMMVAQKYTLIPARVRSNANWTVLFNVNPLDFELVYRDAVLLRKDEWQSLLTYVFGESALKRGDDKEERRNSYNNIGIWVEKNRYFKNFKELSVSQGIQQRELT